MFFCFASTMMAKTALIPQEDYDAFFASCGNNDVTIASTIFAKYRNHKHRTKLLLSKENDLYGIHLAAARGNLEIITYVCSLLTPESRKILLNLKSCDGRTALFFAIQNGHHDVVQCLLKEGASWDIQADFDHPRSIAVNLTLDALGFAIYCNDVVSLLLILQYLPENDRQFCLQKIYSKFHYQEIHICKSIRTFMAEQQIVPSVTAYIQDTLPKFLLIDLPRIVASSLVLTSLFFIVINQIKPKKLP